MARNITQFSVFVSSPGGIEEDRVAVQLAVDEANKILAPENISLSTYLWERDIVPGRGEGYAQTIINKQIDEETDIFILLMHSRVGASTPTALSGTIEEFDRINSIVENKRRPVEVCIYFSIAPISPSTDAVQLGLVQDFKRRVQALSYMTKEYDTGTSLRMIMISHLIAKARLLSGRESFAGSSEIQSSNVYREFDDVFMGGLDDSSETMGPLDYEHLAIEKLTEATSSIVSVGSLVEKYALVMERDRGEITRLADAISKGLPVDKLAAINSFCRNLNSHLDDLEPEASRFEESFSEAASATLGLAQEWPINSPEAANNLSEFIDTVEAANLQLSGLLEATTNIPIFFEQWPGLTKVLKIAKKRGRRVYQRLNDSLLRNGQTLAAAVAAGRARL